MNSLPAVTVTALPVPADKNYRPAVARFNRWLQDRPVTEETVREFFHAHRNYAAATLHLWKCAVKHAVLKAMPTHDTRVLAAMRETFRQIKIPRSENRLQNGDVFTPEEIRKIVRVLPSRMGLFVRALYNTGARVSELAGVRLDDCTEGKDVVRMRIKGKGGLEGTLLLDKKLWKQIVSTCAGDTFLFERGIVRGARAVQKGRPWARTKIWRYIDQAAQHSLGRRAHPHQMRHSRATHLLEENPLAAVSRFLRHKKQSTTLTYYAHNQLTTEQVMKGRL